MEGVVTVGLDIAKSVFQVHGVDAGRTDQRSQNSQINLANGEPSRHGAKPPWSAGC